VIGKNRLLTASFIHLKPAFAASATSQGKNCFFASTGEVEVSKSAHCLYEMRLVARQSSVRGLTVRCGVSQGSGHPLMNRSKQGGMANKTIVVLIIGLAFVPVPFAEAQQPKKVPRIGYVSSGDPSTEPRLAAFRRGLRDLGYIEGKNIQVEYRYVEGKADQSSGVEPSSCNSTSMCLSLDTYQRSTQPSRRPRQPPLSW
jgi:hypothetical protein